MSGSGGTLVNYSYLADGTKISALDDQGNGLEYRGSLTFRRNGSSLQIEGIGFPGGRFVAEEDSTGSITLVPHFHITDHLGSVRAVVDGSTGQVIETNDYYPFGKRWDSSSSVTSPDNRFRFNGKEDQSEFGSSLSDYGARQHSASTGRWLAMDPLAEKYYSSSPYAFCGNNPVNFVDLDGRFPDAIWDVTSIGIGIHNLIDNIQSGNIRGAIGDGVGIAIDAIAAAVPLIPGGVGAIRAGAKIANTVDNAADAARTVSKTADVGNVSKSTDVLTPFVRGRMNEKRALNDFGLTKNTKTVQGKTSTGELRGTIPDAITSDAVYEVKDVQNLSNTKQIQAQIEYVKRNNLDYKIITGTQTQISKNIPNEYIIQLDYLGPQ